MAETKDTRRGNLPTPKGGKKFWIKRDAVADTFSIIVGTQKEFQNDTGTTAFQIKSVSTLKSKTAIPTENQGDTFNQELIEQYGGSRFLEFSIEQGLKAVGDERTEITQSAEGQTGLPPLQDGTLLNNTFQVFAETIANSTNFNLGDIPNVTTLSRKDKIGGAGVLKYPEDMDTNVQDYLQISVFSYKAAKKIPTISKPVDTTRNLRQEKALEIIQIPVPNSVADQNTIEWGGGKMTSTAGELGNAVVSPLFKDDSSLLGGLKGLADVGVTLATDAAREAIGNPFIRRRFIANQIASSISGALGISFDINQAITRLGGVVENPNLELLFTGPALRTFSFTVRFTPRSDTEAKRVRTIIRVLKQRSAVKKGVKFLPGEGGENLLLGTPDVFKLQYKNAAGDIKGVNKIKTCALTSLSVDYTGGSGRWSTYEVDSQPVTTIVQMGFSELAPIYDTDYTPDNFVELNQPLLSDDDVGF
jgi:hypothetical protein